MAGSAAANCRDLRRRVCGHAAALVERGVRTRYHAAALVERRAARILEGLAGCEGRSLTHDARAAPRHLVRGWG